MLFDWYLLCARCAIQVVMNVWIYLILFGIFGCVYGRLVSTYMSFGCLTSALVTLETRGRMASNKGKKSNKHSWICFKNWAFGTFCVCFDTATLKSDIGDWHLTPFCLSACLNWVHIHIILVFSLVNALFSRSNRYKWKLLFRTLVNDPRKQNYYDVSSNRTLIYIYIKHTKVMQ